MFNKTLVVTVLASVLALGVCAPAFAAGDRDGRGGHGGDHGGRPAHGGGPGWGNERGSLPQRGGPYAHRPPVSHGYQGGYAPPRHDNRHAPPRMVMGHVPPPMVYRQAPPPYGWGRGLDYRRGYAGPVYVVNDYARYDLRHPPYGHRWIRDDRGNYLMVAIATGIIADLLLHH